MKRDNLHNVLRTILLTAALAVLATAVSCSKEGAQEPGSTEGDRTIRLTAAVACSANGGSKAPVVDGTDKAVLTGIHFLRRDSVAAPKTYAGVTALAASRDAVGAITFTSTAPTYALTGENAYLTAYYPGTGATIETDKAQWTIDGKTDILVAPTWNAGSYLHPQTLGMTFEHQLAQLEVVCKATSASGVTADAIRGIWGTITKIEIVNNFSQAVYNYGTMQTTFQNQADVALLKPDYQTAFTTLTIPDNTNTAVNAAGMFAPQQGAIVLKVTTSLLGSVNLQVQLQQNNENVDFTRGNRHRVTIEFEKSQLLVALYTQVADWSEGYRTDGEIDMPSEEVLKPNQGYLDMNYSKLINSGSLNGTAFTAVSTTNSYNGNTYNTSNADNNSGYKATIAAALAEPLYYKLEVAKADETAAAGTSGWNAAGSKATWPKAWSACKAKAPAGAWRLPRESELAWMYLNKTELEKTPGFTAFEASSYWSGTEQQPGGYEYIVEFSDGTSRLTTSGYAINVRCVREVNPPTPVVEDYYYSDGTFSRNLQKSKTVEGVVCWIDETNFKHFKIVSMDEPPANWDGGTNAAGCLPWSPESIEAGATDLSDGKANTLTLMKRSNAATAYPAAKWCYTKNKNLTVPASASETTSGASYHWYLPAKYELQHLFSAYWGVAPTRWASDTPGVIAASGYPAAWNARFTATPFTVASYYWTSTEVANFYMSCVVSFSDGNTFNILKNSTDTRTRCVREITLP